MQTALALPVPTPGPVPAIIAPPPITRSDARPEDTPTKPVASEAATALAGPAPVVLFGLDRRRRPHAACFAGGISRRSSAPLMKNARDFDGDPYAGRQEPESYRLVSLSSDARDAARVVVTARFDIQGLPDARPRIAYGLVRDADRWRIDDIRHLGDGDASMRRLLRGQCRLR